MPNFQVVSRERHGHQGWLRYTSYAFAMKETVLPLTLAELPKAMMSLPIELPSVFRLPKGGIHATSFSWDCCLIQCSWNFTGEFLPMRINSGAPYRASFAK